MAFTEQTVEEIVRNAERDGAPPSVAMRLEADLAEVLHAHRRRMDRINRHTEVLSIVADAHYNVTRAAEILGVSREAIYKHLRKSTELPSGVDGKAA